MSEDDQEIIGDQRLELLIAEYQEVGEEARSRDSLIHNSFYLVLFAIGAFLIAEVNAITGGETILVIAGSVISFFVFLFLSLVIYTFTTYRASMWSRRADIESEIRNYHDGVFIIQQDAVVKRLPPGQSTPRDLNSFEGLSTKYVAHIVALLAFLSLIPAIAVLLWGYNWIPGI